MDIVAYRAAIAAKNLQYGTFYVGMHFIKRNNSTVQNTVHCTSLKVIKHHKNVQYTTMHFIKSNKTLQKCTVQYNALHKNQ